MTSRRPVASLGLAALLGVQLAKGKRQKVNLTLTEAIEIYARGLTTTEKRQSAAAQSQRLTLGHESWGRMIEAIIADALSFSEDKAAKDDDMTVVVARFPWY